MSTLGDILFGLIFYWIADLLSRQYFSFGGSRTLEGMPLDRRRLEYAGCMEAAWTLDRGPYQYQVPDLRCLN
jgi:hypothetical protein